MGFFINAASAQGQGGGMDNASSAPFMILMVFLALYLYFFLIRPQAKRAKEQRNMVSSLQKGDEIVTSGGILGKITDLGNNYVMLEIAEGVQVRLQRNAIASLVPKGTIKSDL